MSFEWDPRKAEANYKKHLVYFSETFPVFEDDYAITIADDVSDPGEQRFVSIGLGARGRVLVVTYSYRERKIRIISARLAGSNECRQYEENR